MRHNKPSIKFSVCRRKQLVYIKSASIRTHLTEGQWSYINKVFFENDCIHRKYSFQLHIRGILYILVSGCQWRMLPHDLPKWQTVYWYFHAGRTEGYLESLYRKTRHEDASQT